MALAWKCWAVGVRLSALGLRRDPHGSVKQIHHEELEDVTQYSLLVNIERAGQLSHAVLAEKVGMDRTTLTRNLRPLTRAKWATAGTGKDRRQRLLQLTAAGRRKLLRSLPLWEEAQRQFLSQIGTESLQELRTLLTSAESAVTNAFTADL